eukprot:Skav225105  [mRNA]  locus=scaffold3924:92771:102028:- [translate_table: standard]
MGKRAKVPLSHEQVVIMKKSLEDTFITCHSEHVLEGCCCFDPSIMGNDQLEVDVMGDFWPLPFSSVFRCHCACFDGGIGMTQGEAEPISFEEPLYPEGQFDACENSQQHIVADLHERDWSFLRGGAGGSATTKRKRRINELIALLQTWAKEDDEDHEDEVDEVLQQLDSLTAKWRRSGSKAMATLASKIKEDTKAPAEPTTWKQSFYQEFLKPKMDKSSKDDEKKGKGKGKGKKGKGKDLGLDTPKFDLAKSFPRSDIAAANAVMRALELGTVPSGAVTVCSSYCQALQMQELAKVHGVVKKMHLVCKYDEAAQEKIPGSTVVNLPWIGNLAWVRALVACLNEEEPRAIGEDTVAAEASIPVETLTKATETLRIVAPVRYQPRQLLQQLYPNPVLLLTLLGLHLSEVRTSGWRGSDGAIVGYINVPSSEVQKVLARSGKGGVFVGRLASNVTKLPPARWVAQCEDESHLQYLARVQAMGEREEVPLCYRRGGGAELGIQKAEDQPTVHAWVLFGMPNAFGPESVKQLLEELKWKVDNRPREPQRRNQPWVFQGVHQDEPFRQDWSLKVKIGDTDHHLGIRRWQKIRKIQEESERLPGQRWWGVQDVVDLSTHEESQQVAPTLPDPPSSAELEDKVMAEAAECEADEADKQKTRKDLENKASPDNKKKYKTDKPMPPPVDIDEDKVYAGMCGPKVVNLGGSGDCGWRCLGVALAIINASSPSKFDPQEHYNKALTLGKSLQSKTATWLKNTSTGWKDSWAVDSTATVQTEAGTPAQNLAEFCEHLGRHGRWICGLTMQGVSSMKQINIVVFKLMGGQWTKVALLTPGGQYKKHKTVGLVLAHQHYFLLELKNGRVPKSWLNDDKDALVTFGIQDEAVSQFTPGTQAEDDRHVKLRNILRAGMEMSEGAVDSLMLRGYQTPRNADALNEEDLDRLLRTCSPIKAEDDLLRTCSSLSSKTSEKLAQFQSNSKVKDWRCPLCRATFDKHYGAAITRHLQRAHRKEYHQSLERMKSRGATGNRTHLGPGAYYIPAKFIKMNAECRNTQAKFTCGYCDKSLPVQVPNGHKTRLAKFAHIRECTGMDDKTRKSFLKSKTLTSFHWKGMNKHNPMLKSVQMKTKRNKAIERAKQRGHHAVYVPLRIGWANNPTADLLVCTTCRLHVYNRNWMQQCRGERHDMPPDDFWRRAKKNNDVAAVAKAWGFSQDEINKVVNVSTTPKPPLTHLQKRRQAASKRARDKKKALAKKKPLPKKSRTAKAQPSQADLDVADRPHAIFVQETCCDDEQAKSVSDVADGLGYVTYHSGAHALRKRPNDRNSRYRRGVMTLVHRSVRSSWKGAIVEHECQSLAIQIDQVLTLNSYGIPSDEASRKQVEITHRLLWECQWAGRWLITGDWNQTFQDSWLQTLAEAEHASLLDMSGISSTRWLSTRVIDLVVSNFDCDTVCHTRPEKISDRKILEWQVRIHENIQPESKVKPKLVFARPHWLTTQAWHLLFQEAFHYGQVEGWSEVCAFLQPHTPQSLDSDEDVDQSIVDYTWEMFSLRITWSLRLAAQLALQALPAEYTNEVEIRRVERLANSKLAHQLHSANLEVNSREMPRKSAKVNMRFRKWTNQLGRCYELKRRTQRDVWDLETQSLIRKIFGDNPFALPVLEKKIKVIEGLLKEEEKCRKNELLHKWKDRMTSSISQRAQWLHKQGGITMPSVGSPESATDTKQGAAAAMFQYWDNFLKELQWSQEDERAAIDVVSGVLSRFSSDFEAQRPDVESFRDRLWLVKGCAGLDGWTKEELRTIASCLDASSDAWGAMLLWEQLGLPPSQLRHCRIACLPKESKIVEHTLLPAGFRPVSILSGWWRAWSSTWLRSDSVARWSGQFLPSTIAGGTPTSVGPEVMASLLDAELSQRGYGVSMDFQHAFDCVNTTVMREALLKVAPAGLHPWITLLTTQWSTMSRWFSFKGHLHEKPLVTKLGVPQGDAASPLFIVLLLRVGHFVIEQQMGNRCFQAIYMDDRSAITASFQDALAIKDLWLLFADAFHMRENTNKIQLIDLSGQEEDSKPFAEVLGCVIGKPQSLDLRDSSRCAQRLNKACRMAGRIGLLPLPILSRHEELHVFCKTAFAYGWVAAFPHSSFCRRYDKMLWRSIGKMSYAVKQLRSAVQPGGDPGVPVAFHALTALRFKGINAAYVKKRKEIQRKRDWAVRKGGLGKTRCRSSCGSNGIPIESQAKLLVKELSAMRSPMAGVLEKGVELVERPQVLCLKKVRTFSRPDLVSHLSAIDTAGVKLGFKLRLDLLECQLD